jgi:hypothetical protein
MKLYTMKKLSVVPRLLALLSRTFSPHQLVPISDLVWLHVAPIQCMGKKRDIILYSTLNYDSLSRCPSNLGSALAQPTLKACYVFSKFR